MDLFLYSLFRPTGILVGRDKVSGNGTGGCELLNDQLVIDKELIVVVLRVNFCSLDIMITKNRLNSRFNTK